MVRRTELVVREGREDGGVVADKGVVVAVAVVFDTCQGVVPL